MKRISIVVGLALMLLPVCAFADSVTITSAGSYPSVTINVINYEGLLGETISTQAEKFLVNGMDAYCVDLSHYLSTPTTVDADFDQMINWGTNDDPSPGYSGTGGAAAWLYQTYAGSVSGDTNLEAALQIAIWEVLYELPPEVQIASLDPIYSVSGGNISFTNINEGILDSAQTMLTDVGTSNAIWVRTANVGTFTQDLITTPEPTSLLLLGTGLLGLAGFARRRMKK